MSAVATYVIEKRGEKWCLLTHDRSRVLGCHDSQADAEAQERAVQARKHAEKDLYTVPAVEIFRTGKWNGDDYSTQDLDAMVAAASTVGFTPPIKAGHEDAGGKPALGWVENLRRVGSTLVADLVALPKKVYDAIKRRSYDRVSAEIYWDLERNGQTFPRVLKALALLGAEIPAVDLQPLHAFLSMPPMPSLPAAKFATYAVDLKAHAVVITREQMAALCPECATQMTAKKITALRIPRDDAGTYDFAEAFKPYAGFSDALCEKFSPAEGFRTRCAGTMAANVDDAEAFCNSLKEWCGLMAERRRAKMADDNKDQAIADLTAEVAQLKQQLQAKDGEIVVPLTQLKEMQEKIARLEPLEAVEVKLQQKETELDEVQEQHRRERVAHKVAGLKIPALRSFARVFYDLALHTNGARTYTLLGEGKKQLSAEDIVDAWIGEMNQKADWLFQTFSTKSKPVDTDEPDEPGARVAYRVQKYLEQNKLDRVKDYRKALTTVLDADPELKLAYSTS